MLEPEEIKRWERMTAAMLRHAGKDDPEAFAQIVGVLDGARAKLPDVCAHLRGLEDVDSGESRPTYSWAQIAAPLGVTRQAAAMRFGRN